MYYNSIDDTINVIIILSIPIILTITIILFRGLPLLGDRRLLGRDRGAGFRIKLGVFITGTVPSFDIHHTLLTLLEHTSSLGLIFFVSSHDFFEEPDPCHVTVSARTT